LSKSRVIVVRHPKVSDKSGKIDSNILSAMLSVGLLKLTQEKDISDGLSHFFTPIGHIGMKTNCLSGKDGSTHPELAYGISSILSKSGIKNKDIFIWDRSNRELKEAGFKINTNGDGPRCFGTDAYRVGYAEKLYTYKNIGSLFSRIFIDFTDTQINLPVLKDHTLAGITCGMKNLFGIIHNPNKYHSNNCDPYVADLSSMPLVRDKIKLIICDCIGVQYNAGPSFHPQWWEKYDGILMGTDQVAVDFVGYTILDQIRAKKGLPSLKKIGEEPKYIFTAADSEHNLGNVDLKNIDVVELNLS
jgi:uncharacterized protein (DUF362 family)